MKLKRIRILLGSIFFLLTTLLFLDFTGTLHHWFGWMAKIQFLPALLAMNFIVVAVLIALTLVFGRIYCSVICPLGVFQDVVAWVHNRRKKHRYSYSKAVNWLRYAFLAVMVVALIAGIGSLVALLAPYSSYGRIASNLFQPVYIAANNVLAYFAECADSYAFYSVDVWIKSLPTFIIAAVTFVLIAVLAWRNGRTYCNTICPVGTVLGFLARFSWFKIYFDEEKCRSCSKCSKGCKASCIDFKTHTVDYSRCIVCGDCLADCHFDALHYGRKKKAVRAEVQVNSHGDKGVDKSKRSFLLATAMVSTAALAEEKMKLDGGLAVLKERKVWKRNTPLTPPGSMSADNMAQHCTGCQLCVAECPNGVLRPSTDLMKLMQPTMSYERGFCRPECTRCSELCPAGAIKPISREEKSSTQIGHAVWQPFNCIVLTDGVECGNCSRHCPAGAIEMVANNPDDEESPYVPAVDETRCIGCGACEYVCPARPFTAIHVEGHEVHKVN